MKTQTQASTKLKVAIDQNIVHHEHEHLAMFLYENGEVRLSAHAASGMSFDEGNRIFVSMRLGGYDWDYEFGGRVLPKKSFRKFVAENSDLIKKVLESFGEVYWDGQNHVRDIDGNLLAELDEIVHFYDHQGF